MKLFGPFGFFRFLTADLFLYVPIRFVLLNMLRLAGQKRSVVGQCIIWAPPKQMQIILEGIAHLQTIDREMFLRLTAKRRYVFWYQAKQFIECREIFTIPENYLQWGKEGVIACFVQAIMDFNLKYLPLKKGVEVTNRREIQKHLFEFVNKHSFSPELVDFYRKEANPELLLDKS